MSFERRQQHTLRNILSFQQSHNPTSSSNPLTIGPDSYPASCSDLPQMPPKNSGQIVKQVRLKILSSEHNIISVIGLFM